MLPAREELVEALDGDDAVLQRVLDVSRWRQQAEVRRPEADHRVRQKVVLLGQDAGLKYSGGRLTSCDICDTSCQTDHPPMGSDGYAQTRKCWKKRRSAMLKEPGAGSALVRAGRVPVVTATTSQPALEYSHLRPRRRHGPHSGITSSHFTLRCLQLGHPARDLVWPLRGIGRRRAVAGAGGVDLGADKIEPDVVYGVTSSLDILQTNAAGW